MTMKEKLALHQEMEEKNKAAFASRGDEEKKAVKKALVLRTDGRFEIVDYPETDVVRWCYQQIDCDLVEVVRPKGLPEGMVLVCDEEFLLKDKPVLNPLASYLYGMQDHGNPICGDCVLMREVDGWDGYTLDGLSEEEADGWKHKFMAVAPFAQLLLILTTG